MLLGLCVMLGVFGTPLRVYAEPSEGVKVSIEPDKTAYRTGDTATFTVNITNESVQAAREVSYTVELPEGMEPVDESAIKGVVSELDAGDSASMTIEARVAAASQAKEGTTENNIPQTGDNVLVVAAACAGVGLLLCCVACLVYKRGKVLGALVVVVCLVAVPRRFDHIKSHTQPKTNRR